ncbi:RNA-directed DNA polymerase, eukaryota, reverse transcriptase zinc-binding domain protein, partial [Tanacetum coccineum]
MDFKIASWNIRGISNELRQKEVMKFIADDKLQPPTSCRIMIGWNANVVNVMLVHGSSQDMLCKIEDVQGKVKLFVDFDYASNSIPERRKLLSNLQISKRIVNNNSWIIIGDFNVTINPNEKSTGASVMTREMGEFCDAIQSLEIDDICSSGFF